MIGMPLGSEGDLSADMGGKTPKTFSKKRGFEWHRIRVHMIFGTPRRSY